MFKTINKIYFKFLIRLWFAANRIAEVSRLAILLDIQLVSQK